jgi:hypothetical protein
MHLTRSQPFVWSRTVPGQADFTHDTSGRANPNCQPAPTLSQLQRSAASAWRGRTDVQPSVCLKKPNACLDRESAHRPAPQHAQVSRERTADPGQPQRPRWQLRGGQALDLHADHAERRSRCTTHVQVGPGVHRHAAGGRMIPLTRSLRLAMRAVIGQAKRLAIMQARSATAGTPFGRALHHAAW